MCPKSFRLVDETCGSTLSQVKVQLIQTGRTGCEEELQEVLLKAVATGFSLTDLRSKSDQDVQAVMAVVVAGKIR
jgi:hypothetical protein